MIRVSAPLLLVLSLCAPAHALVESSDSASYMLTGCTAALDQTDKRQLGMQGQCIGILNAYAYIGSTLPEAVRFCAPSSATPGQSIKIVLRYIKDRSGRVNDDFRQLALEALHVAWPCAR